MTQQYRDDGVGSDKLDSISYTSLTATGSILLPNCVMVARETLNLFVKVQILIRQPFIFVVLWCNGSTGVFEALRRWVQIPEGLPYFL